MRIISGKYRGKALKWTDATTTRPTKDRVRESLFNVLENSLQVSLKDTRVLDLFSGTGSLVLEALSRGAAHGTFVETNPKVRTVLWENIRALNAESQSQVIGLKAQTVLNRGNTDAPYDVIFLDPPYRIEYWTTLLDALKHPTWTHSSSLLVLETFKDFSPSHPAFEEIHTRTYGIVKIMFLKPVQR